MHYHNYPTTTHQVHPSTQSSTDYPSPYPDQSHPHATMPYAAVTPAAPLPAGSLAHQYHYPSYPTHGSPDDHRQYYAPSTQGPAIEQYHSPSSPGHVSQGSRHQPQQFIPTPSQAYQFYSSTGSTSPGRSRSTVEPYYHMSPNPQHTIHASPVSATHAPGTSSRGSTSHGSVSPHHHHVHSSTHTGTIVVAAGERYPCDLCDRSFTRLHDRRRHYETVHATSPVLHKCRYCRKDFSRADSLKRHIDNGCDEMPR